MCRLQNLAMRDYQESVTTGQTHRQTDTQTQDKVIPMCRYASQETQKLLLYVKHVHIGPCDVNQHFLTDITLIFLKTFEVE